MESQLGRLGHRFLQLQNPNSSQVPYTTVLECIPQGVFDNWQKKKKRETELGGEKRCGLLKEFCVSLNSFLQLSVSSKPLEVKEALAQQLGNVGSNPVSH